MTLSLFVLGHLEKRGNVEGADFFFFFFFLINCWSSVVASVVLPQLCNLHCFFFFSKERMNPHGIFMGEGKGEEEGGFFFFFEKKKKRSRKG